MNRFNWADPPSRSAFPIAAPGMPFIFAAGFVTIIFALIQFVALAVLGVFVTLFICYFFRDPDRVTPEEPNAVIAPADGRVVSIQKIKSNPYTEGPCLRIGIFMSIFNVHVNRVPYAGKIREIRYYPGKFHAADKEEASTANEQNAVILATGQDQEIGVVQIAGLVARRIICWAKENNEMSAGQRFGLICFGSRVDLYLPEDTEPAVSKGDRVAAGKTIIAHLK